MGEYPTDVGRVARRVGFPSLKVRGPWSDISHVMWMISLVFVTLLLVPAAVFAASTAHGSPSGQGDGVGPGPEAGPGRPR